MPCHTEATDGDAVEHVSAKTRNYSGGEGHLGNPIRFEWIRKIARKAKSKSKGKRLGKMALWRGVMKRPATRALSLFVPMLQLGGEGRIA